jgi:YrhK-like protein
MSASPGGSASLIFTMGHEEVVIRRRYEVLSIINDILVAIWFLVGSILFFSEATTYAGTWLFVLGSVELLIRPMIRLARRVHLQRLPDARGGATEAGPDF